MSNTSGAVKLQWAALVVLVLAVIALLVLLFNQQREYRSQATTAEVGASAPQSPVPTASASPSAGQKSKPTASASPSTAESRDSVDAVTTAAQAVVNSKGDVVISVLGDSTSDSASEWVYRWAQALGQNATVVVHTWNPEIDDWFPQTRQFGHGARTVTIWNGSEAGATPEAPLAQEDLRQPTPAHLTILNYGHNGSTDEVESSLTELLKGLKAGTENAAPVVLTAQNPATGQEAETSDANRELMQSAATKHGLPVIDVHAAFADSDDWTALLMDRIHPNEQGQQLWTSTVSAFFAR